MNKRKKEEVQEMSCKNTRAKKRNTFSREPRVKKMRRQVTAPRRNIRELQELDIKVYQPSKSLLHYSITPRASSPRSTLRRNWTGTWPFLQRSKLSSQLISTCFTFNTSTHLLCLNWD